MIQSVYQCIRYHISLNPYITVLNPWESVYHRFESVLNPYIIQGFMYQCPTVIMTCVICKFMLCDNRPIERVRLCVSADQAPERNKKVWINIAVNAPMHVQANTARSQQLHFPKIQK